MLRMLVFPAVSGHTRCLDLEATAFSTENEIVYTNNKNGEPGGSPHGNADACIVGG